ncbi:MAG: alpha-ketoacid dehydrogenase subunit beta, partial [Rhodococcus sp. (in: high G+C Gram-positive bacteria)]
MTSVEAENVSKKTYREAVKEAIAQEMQRDPSVVLIGEDVRG